jgi:hypothetical protein
MTATKLRGGFRNYLKKQSESSLWDGKGDEAHDGAYYQTGAASCFFPVAARELVKDGLNHVHIAHFCIHGALEALTTGGMSREQAEQELLRLVLANRVTDEDPRKPPQ